LLGGRSNQNNQDQSGDPNVFESPLVRQTEFLQNRLLRRLVSLAGQYHQHVHGGPHITGAEKDPSDDHSKHREGPAGCGGYRSRKKEVLRQAGF
jgi:hypothetical protein